MNEQMEIHASEDVAIRTAIHAGDDGQVAGSGNATGGTSLGGNAYGGGLTLSGG